MKRQIKTTINGREYCLDVEPRRTLLVLLREQLQLTGTKEGCGTGDCGACTVLLDGEPVNACLILGVEIDGCQVTTIEGLADGDELHPVQTALMDHGGMQCGFCTPGVALSSAALLRTNPDPDEDAIRAALAGNLCRCTGYTKIVEAVQAAAGKCRERLREGG
jgi:aerobic carbon-monoxide dehydrogenase small subunit